MYREREREICIEKERERKREFNIDDVLVTLFC